MKKILKWVFPVILSIIPAMGMDKDDSDQYHQRYVTSSRSNVLKTAIVGLGLMLSPTPAESLTEFGGCYLMKGNIQRGGTRGIPTDVFRVSEIRTSGCPSETFEPFAPLGKTKEISMSLTIDNYIITNINLCSRIFNVKYTNVIDNGFNMSGNNCYFPIQCTDNYLVTVDKSDRNRGKDNIVFDSTFARFINTGNCPVSTNPF